MPRPRRVCSNTRGERLCSRRSRTWRPVSTRRTSMSLRTISLCFRTPARAALRACRRRDIFRFQGACAPGRARHGAYLRRTDELAPHMEPSFSTLRPSRGRRTARPRQNRRSHSAQRARAKDRPPGASRGTCEPIGRATKVLSETPARGYAALDARHVLSAAEGCDFDFLTCRNAQLESEYPSGAIRPENCHVANSTSAKCRRLRNCQAAATAVRHVVIATARSARCVWAEMRWRWTLKVL